MRTKQTTVVEVVTLIATGTEKVPNNQWHLTVVVNNVDAILLSAMSLSLLDIPKVEYACWSNEDQCSWSWFSFSIRDLMLEVLFHPLFSRPNPFAVKL